MNIASRGRGTIKGTTNRGRFRYDHLFILVVIDWYSASLHLQQSSRLESKRGGVGSTILLLMMMLTSEWGGGSFSTIHPPPE